MIRSDVTILHFVNELTLFHHPVGHHHPSPYPYTHIASMNTAKSVVSLSYSITHGFKLITGIRMGRKLFDSKLDPDEQALVVAAGGSYYYAKKDLKGRKLDPAVRESRLRESTGNGNGTGTVTCESDTSTMI